MLVFTLHFYECGKSNSQSYLPFSRQPGGISTQNLSHYIHELMRTLSLMRMKFVLCTSVRQNVTRWTVNISASMMDNGEAIASVNKVSSSSTDNIAKVLTPPSLPPSPPLSHCSLCDTVRFIVLLGTTKASIYVLWITRRVIWSHDGPIPTVMNCTRYVMRNAKMSVRFTAQRRLCIVQLSYDKTSVRLSVCHTPVLWWNGPNLSSNCYHSW